jgi:hypothetical protein
MTKNENVIMENRKFIFVFILIIITLSILITIFLVFLNVFVKFYFNETDIEQYYKTIDINSPNFKYDLHNLISNHLVLNYSSIWNAFQILDTNISPCNKTQIIDIYSSKCWVKYFLQLDL